LWSFRIGLRIELRTEPRRKLPVILHDRVGVKCRSSGAVVTDAGLNGFKWHAFALRNRHLCMAEGV